MIMTLLQTTLQYKPHCNINHTFIRHIRVLLVTRFSLWNVISVQVTVLAKSIRQNQNSGFCCTLETRFNHLLPQWAGVSVACTAFYLSCLPCLLPSFCLCVCSLFLFWSQWFYLNIRGCLEIIVGAVAAFSMHFTFRTSNHIRQLWTGSYILYGHHHNLIQKMFLTFKKRVKAYKLRVIMACIQY